MSAAYDCLKVRPPADQPLRPHVIVFDSANLDFFIAHADVALIQKMPAEVPPKAAALGILPGGSGTQRLPRIVGRGRALEIVLGCKDFPAELAKRYGWLNRALPPAELGPFVERLAYRIASFPADAIALAKASINAAELPTPQGLLEEAHLFNAWRSSSRGEARRVRANSTWNACSRRWGTDPAASGGRSPLSSTTRARLRALLGLLGGPLRGLARLRHSGGNTEARQHPLHQDHVPGHGHDHPEPFHGSIVPGNGVLHCPRFHSSFVCTG